MILATLRLADALRAGAEFRRGSAVRGARPRTKSKRAVEGARVTARLGVTGKDSWHVTLIRYREPSPSKTASRRRSRYLSFFSVG